MPGNPLTARTITGAIATAVNRGKTTATITLLSGERFGFNIAEVIEGGLVGTRVGMTHTATIVLIHAVAVIEFPG